MDATVIPGDDFYAYANGGWLREHPPADDQASTGVWPALQVHAREQSRRLLEAASHRPGSRMGDLYASFLDQATRDRLGMSPMHDWLARIDSVTDRKRLARVAGELAVVDVGTLFGLGIGEDDGRPGWNVVTIGQGGLGLRDASAYTEDTPTAIRQRAAYARFLQAMLGFTGVAPDDATKRVRAVIDFERKLGASHWQHARTRDAEATYHQVAPADLDRLAPGFAWPTYLQAMGLAAQRSLVLAEPDAIRGAAALSRTTPLPVMRDYLRLHLLAAFSRYLGTAQQDARFAFYGTALKGLTQEPAPWQSGVALATNL
jgi:putative endopeptidase